MSGVYQDASVFVHHCISSFRFFIPDKWSKFSLFRQITRRLQESDGRTKSVFAALGADVGALFTRRRWISTLLVLAAMGVMTRLGFWQLDRLAQRRAYNAETAQRLAAAPLLLTGGEELGPDVSALRNRRVIVAGEYDFSQEIALRGQSWDGQPGLHLITPLHIEGSTRAVLVERGWVPAAEAAPQNWRKFAQPGRVQVSGLLLLSQTTPSGPLLTHQSGRDGSQTDWYWVDIPAIQAQMPYELLPVYIQQAPPPENVELPYRSAPEFDLSDGPHLGYAIQWFAFALMLGIGYVRAVWGGGTK